MSILTQGYSIGSQVYGGIETLGNIYEQFFGEKEELGRRGKLDEFVSNTGVWDFARSSHFRFRILPSGALASGIASFNKEFTPKDLGVINMLCDSTTLPDIASIPITGKVSSEFSYDITKDLAYASQSASFYVAEDMFQKKFFDNWMELTYHKPSGQPYYYNNYTTTLEIYQLKRTLDDSVLTGDNDWTYKVKLHNVYPKAIAPMTLDWSSSNALQKMSVTFHYTHWDSEINSK
jgi:hypothetical protein